jgi:hypothetical protein
MPYADDNTSKHIFGYVMNQMTAKAGIKKHGKAAEAALPDERISTTRGAGCVRTHKREIPFTREQRMGAL